MTLAEVPSLASEPDAETRRPRIAIMGEFSAGKSTLTNLLLGEPALPVKVTATQLPPVWISHGEGAPCRVDIDGTETPVDLEDLSDIDVSETQWIRVFHTAEALSMCDLIDMPGISDPNMPSEVWERLADEIDAVIWCTHANQAWRQSEDAVWSGFPPEIQERSLLLITRFDKIVAERDRQRLVRRVESEVEGLFRGVFPISLTEALKAGEDEELWVSSGADAFANALVDLTTALARAAEPAWNESQQGQLRRPAPAQPALLRPLHAGRDAPAAPPAPADNTPRVMPQRVRPATMMAVRPQRPPRPPAEDAAS